jgi:hypothetical protein
MEIAQMWVKISADTSKFVSDLEKTKKQVEDTSKRWADFGKRASDVGKRLATFVTLPLFAAGAASIKMASDMSESINKVDVAFKDNAEEIKSWSSTTLRQFGIAKGTALDMAATFGDMATGMGLNTGNASEMSRSLVGLAGDLASFKNISIDIANTALTGVFTGETESLKQLGIVMTQANLQEYAYAQGINKKIQEMNQAEQVMLRYNYVMEMTKNAQGDFSNTSSGAANQMRIFSESLKELGATFGANILPVVTSGITTINKWVQAFGELDGTSQKLIVGMAAVAAAAGPLLIVVGSAAGLFASLSTIAAGMGITVGALVLPIVGVTAAIAALVTGGILLYKNWDTIKAKAMEVWTSLKNTVSDAIIAVKTKISEMVQIGKDVAAGLWKGLSDSADWLKNKVIGWAKSVLPDPILKLLGISSPAKKGIDIGVWFAKGLAIGLGEGQDGVITQAQLLADSVISIRDRLQALNREYEIAKIIQGENSDSAQKLREQIAELAQQYDAWFEATTVTSAGYMPIVLTVSLILLIFSSISPILLSRDSISLFINPNWFSILLSL